MLKPKSNIILHKSHPSPVLSGQLTVIIVCSFSPSASFINTASSYNIPISLSFLLNTLFSLSREQIDKSVNTKWIGVFFIFLFSFPFLFLSSVTTLNQHRDERKCWKFLQKGVRIRNKHLNFPFVSTLFFYLMRYLGIFLSFPIYRPQSIK